MSECGSYQITAGEKISLNYGLLMKQWQFGLLVMALVASIGPVSYIEYLYVISVSGDKGFVVYKYIID